MNRRKMVMERRRLLSTPHPSIPVIPKPGPGERPPLTADFARQQAASTQWRKKKR
jgi:hypothetical protein